MNNLSISAAAAAVSLCLLAPGGAMASEEDRAKELCKDKIRDIYGLSHLQRVWGEQLGNHKFKIHGQAKFDNHKYPFDCKVKNGHVKSYAYHGPNPRYNEHKHKDDDDSNLGTALAVGAGLAIVAALVASQDGGSGSGSGSGSGQSSQLHVNKSVLEDDCHDALQYRIRDEHDYTARVHMNNARIEGHDLVGDAKVKYDRGSPHHASFTCHFDRHGRVMDSRYHLY
jgi:hypothetical protein